MFFVFSPLLHLHLVLSTTRHFTEFFTLLQNINKTQNYKDRIRAELDRQLRAEFDKRTSAELNQAVPPTETLNVEAAKEKAGLARQGSLAERQPPASLVQKRQLMIDASQGSDIPMMEDEVSKLTYVTNNPSAPQTTMTF